MTAIRNAPPALASVPAPAPRSGAVPSTTAPSPVDSSVIDRFEAAASSKGPLVAGNVVGVAAAFVLNGIAIVGGVSHSLTGIGTVPVLPRPTPTPTELVVRRGLGGA